MPRTQKLGILLQSVVVLRYALLVCLLRRVFISDKISGVCSEHGSKRYNTGNRRFPINVF